MASEASGGVIYLVRDVRSGRITPLKAFESKEDAVEFREAHTADYDELGDEHWADYRVSPWVEASFPIQEVPINRSVDPDAEEESR